MEVLIMADKFRTFGFAGSLRKGSFNKSILLAVFELVTPGVEIEICDLHQGWRSAVH
jgi:NAD(P)H-dependent FMN reductase